MAYMDQNSFGIASAAYRREPTVERLVPAALSPIEWLVVAIAEQDGIASLDAPGRLARTLGVLFGSRRAPGLADPRLEALRRVSVLLWQRRGPVDPAEMNAFRAAGYSQAHYDLVTASIDAGAVARRRPR